jgi:hypothetical protein
MSTREDRDQLSLLPDSDQSTVITPGTGAIEFRSPETGKVTMRANLEVTSLPPRRVRIAKMPAMRLVSGLKWLLTSKAHSRIVAPLVAQEQHEYYEALVRGDKWLARWIAARMYLLILCNTLWAVVAPLLARVFRGAG